MSPPNGETLGGGGGDRGLSTAAPWRQIRINWRSCLETNWRELPSDQIAAFVARYGLSAEERSVISRITSRSVVTRTHVSHSAGQRGNVPLHSWVLRGIAPVELGLQPPGHCIASFLDTARMTVVRLCTMQRGRATCRRGFTPLIRARRRSGSAWRLPHCFSGYKAKRKRRSLGQDDCVRFSHTSACRCEHN